MGDREILFLKYNMAKKSSMSKTSKRRSGPKAKTRKAATVKLIKQVMANEVETKFVAETTMRTSFNSSISAGDKIRLLPKLVQDQGEGNAYERLATKVSPRKLKISCHVSLTPALTRSTAVTVHWFVLTSRQYKNINDVLANANMQRLLRTGNSGQYFPFDGNVDVGMLPVNNTDFTVLKRGSFNLSKNTGLVQDDTTAGNQPIVGPVSKSWSFDLATPAKLIYEQDNNSPRVVYYPNNFAPFIVMGYTHQDGSIPDVLNADCTGIVQTQLYYDDA